MPISYRVSRDLNPAGGNMVHIRFDDEYNNDQENSSMEREYDDDSDDSEFGEDQVYSSESDHEGEGAVPPARQGAGTPVLEVAAPSVLSDRHPNYAEEDSIRWAHSIREEYCQNLPASTLREFARLEVLYNEIKSPDDARFDEEESFSAIMRSIDAKYKGDNASSRARLTVMRNLFQLLTRVRGLEVDDVDMNCYESLISNLEDRAEDEGPLLNQPEFARAGRAANGSHGSGRTDNGSAGRNIFDDGDIVGGADSGAFGGNGGSGANTDDNGGYVHATLGSSHGEPTQLDEVLALGENIGVALATQPSLRALFQPMVNVFVGREDLASLVGPMTRAFRHCDSLRQTSDEEPILLDEVLLLGKNIGTALGSQQSLRVLYKPMVEAFLGHDSRLAALVCPMMREVSGNINVVLAQTFIV
jgi:hypothetical protein